MSHLSKALVVCGAVLLTSCSSVKEVDLNVLRDSFTPQPNFNTGRIDVDAPVKIDDIIQKDGETFYVISEEYWINNITNLEGLESLLLFRQLQIKWYQDFLRLVEENASKEEE